MRNINKVDPSFVATEITEESLEMARADARLKNIQTLKDLTSSRSWVFNRNSTSFKAARHLCICEDLQDYGSCNYLFSSFELRTTQLNKI